MARPAIPIVTITDQRGRRGASSLRTQARSRRAQADWSPESSVDDPAPDLLGPNRQEPAVLDGLDRSRRHPSRSMMTCSLLTVEPPDLGDPEGGIDPRPVDPGGEMSTSIPRSGLG